MVCHALPPTGRQGLQTHDAPCARLGACAERPPAPAAVACRTPWSAWPQCCDRPCHTAPAGAAMEASQACEILALANFPLGNWEEGLRYELRRATPDWLPEIAVAADAHL